MSGMDRYSMSPEGRARARWMKTLRASRGAIRDRSAQNLIFIWIIVLTFNSLTILALLPYFPQAFHSRNDCWLLALAFPAVGMALLVYVVRATWRISKFRSSTFQLRLLPEFQGGDWAGTIHVERTFKPRSAVHLKLSCIHREFDGLGRSARVVERLLWQEKQTVNPPPASLEGTDIPVFFHIPPDAKPSSDFDFDDGIRWRLEARCKTGGVNYFSKFEVPVFVICPSELAAVTRRDRVIRPRPTEPDDPHNAPSERGITCERFACGRLQIRFGVARNKPSVVLSILAGVALCTLALVSAKMPAPGIDRVIMSSISLACLVAAAASFVKAILNALTTEQITVRYGRLTVERRAPLLTQERTFQIADIADVFYLLNDGSPCDAGSSRTKHKRSYSLVLESNDGDVTCLARDITQKQYAAWLADEIRDTLGVMTVK